MPLVIPPAMPKTSGGQIDYYEIAVRQFQQQILPTGMPTTTVWSYGSVNHPSTFNYPAFTIEAKYHRPVRVKWINDLKDANGNYLPHILAVDPTLHWANPPGGTDGSGHAPELHEYAGSLYGPGPDRDPSAWGPQRPGKRRLRRGLVPACGEQHPRGLRHRGHLVRALQERVLDQVWRELGSWHGDLPISERSAGDHALVSRPHAGHDPPECLCGTRGVLSPAPRTRRSSGSPSSRPSPWCGGRPLRASTTRSPSPSRTAPSTPTARCSTRTAASSSTSFAGPYIPDSDVSPIWNPEFFGNTMVVNGRTWPHLEVEPRRYRFRFLNGCNSRFLILKIVTDPQADETGGVSTPLLADWHRGRVPARAGASSISSSCSPSERADVIVDFTGISEGTEFFLINEAPDEPFGGGVPGTDFDRGGSRHDRPGDEIRGRAAGEQGPQSRPRAADLAGVQAARSGKQYAASVAQRTSRVGSPASTAPLKRMLGTLDGGRQSGPEGLGRSDHREPGARFHRDLGDLQLHRGRPPDSHSRGAVPGGEPPAVRR